MRDAGAEVRAPHLYDALRAFCLAAFAQLGPEVEQGQEIPFVARASATGFYEYRPLVARPRPGARATRSRSSRTRGSRSTSCAASRRRAIFARAHAGASRGAGALPGDPAAAARPAPPRPAAASTGRTAPSSGSTPSSSARCSGRTARTRAVAPLVGLSVGAPVELGRGIRVSRDDRRRDLRALAGGARAAAAALRRGAGAHLRPRARARAARRGGRRRPTRPAELADAVTALRLATGAPVAAGPVVFERLDWHPFGVRPLLGIAATEPARRADPARPVARQARRPTCSSGSPRPRTTPSSARRSSAGSSRCSRTSRSARSGCARRSPRCSAARTGSGRRRCGRAVLVGDPGRERAGLVDGLRALARGETAASEAAEVLRRAFVEALLHDDRARLIAAPRRGAARPAGAAARLLLGACDSARIRHEPRDVPRATVERWTRPGACWRGSSGSRRSSGTMPCPATCSTSCGRCCGGRGVGADRADDPGKRGSSRATVPKRAPGFEQDSASLSRKTARHDAGRTGHCAPGASGVRPLKERQWEGSSHSPTRRAAWRRRPRR